MARKKPRQVLQLKRYGGCRLYDPEGRIYVSADDVERLRSEGHRITVRDVETGQDVTDAYAARPTH